MMAACGRRDFDVSVPIIQLLMERDQGVNVAYKAPPSWPRNLYSRLGLSRDTPIKNAASQPELLRLLVGAGATLDAHIVVYAVEDWCDEIAGHLGEVWVRDLANNEVLAPSTLLGVKGGGEGGTTAAPPAVINAIVDALSAFSVRHMEMPVTSEKIWRAIHGAGEQENNQ